MAHPICGIDIGAFSIKFVVFEIGFRHTTFQGAFEEIVGDGTEPLMVRQVKALREGLARVSSDATLYLALPGEQLSIRSLTLPFSDPRKIDQVVGFELESQIVHSLDEVVFDHVLIHAGEDGANVLAVAARREDIGAWLAEFEKQDIDPRALYAAPVIYHALQLEDPAADLGVGEGPVRVPAILDIGHIRSNLFIGRDHQNMSARTITRGGQHLTAAIASAMSLDVGRAERAKRQDARLVRPGTPATRAEQQLSDVLITALAPLVRDVRQTLAGVRAASHLEVSAVYVTGGSANLKGLLPYLEEELGLPVRFLTVPNTLQGSAALRSRGLADADAFSDGVVAEASDELEQTIRLERVASESSPFALATAVGLAASRGGREIDLRRGPFVYRASFSILRQKAAHLALLAAVILVAGGLDVFAALSNLGSERKDLDTKLKAATQELFGQPRTDAKAVASQLRKGFKEELAPVPEATAYDLLGEISKVVPKARVLDSTPSGGAGGAGGTTTASSSSGDGIQLDIAELDIRPKKTFIKGTVDSATAVDEIAEKLKELDCYEEVTKGAVTEVADGAKQFTLNLTSRCP